MGKKRELAQMIKQRKQMVLVEGNLKEFRERNRAEEEAERNPLRDLVGGYRDEDEEVFASHKDPAPEEPKAKATAIVAPQVQKAASVPSPWRKVIDSRTKQPYYWNKATNQTTWKKPDDYFDDEEKESTKTGEDSGKEAKPVQKQDTNTNPPKGESMMETPQESEPKLDEKKQTSSPKHSQTAQTTETERDTSSVDKDEIEKRINQMKASLTGFELDRQIGRIPANLSAPSLDRLRFELDIRVADWKEGEIRLEYFLCKLKLLQEKIQSYGESLPMADDSKADEFVPPLPNSPPPEESDGKASAPEQPTAADAIPISIENWLPIWSEDYSQYYYMHVLTGDITWEPPQSVYYEAKPYEYIDPSAIPASVDESAKKEKTQKVSTMSLKSKKMNTMVEKWKSISANLPDDEEESKDTSEMDADELERMKLKKIEEWKQKQLEKISIAKENPNFTPLPVVNWRARVNLARQRDSKKMSLPEQTQTKSSKKETR